MHTLHLGLCAHSRGEKPIDVINELLRALGLGLLYRKQSLYTFAICSSFLNSPSSVTLARTLIEMADSVLRQACRAGVPCPLALD
jgi:hypothetical protein